ncbi:hypothetical protein RO3G_08681 [Rhizopus delemar RA 99-880]|uniref:Uncharacterized protein n=1 Tax=Rhizopus delemar (strain RA 99-880 / ATCC MYA-4621 / FGSC 9543 / NRRL 43880) TaxID=246409 RepID=I1C696_RHIO9|nr:hypothetical protein RO3G_08681 [Rhizopus delemar RA 99-880]|eukprot:EIE83976.1 hypothetical protein RO3G_08681 [Rhizopus delemar RA 99-880]
MSLVEAAENTYTAAPTELINKSKCDVLYVPNANSAFPPIIIEVQKAVDEKFIIRAIQYCTLVYQKYSKQPIIIIFGILSITMPILSLTTAFIRFPFAKELARLVWAQCCMLISSFSLDVIDKKINQLHPLAAIGVFMCSQATSINMLELGKEDKLMQLLYRIALKSVEQVARVEDEKVQRIVSICNNTSYQLLAFLYIKSVYDTIDLK